MRINRKNFIAHAAAGAACLSAGSILPGFITGGNGADSNAGSGNTANPGSFGCTGSDHLKNLPGLLPGKIAGLTLEELRDDYRNRIFNLYLPFWEKGGYDSELGGFMCELDDDGKVVNDEKYIWYQARGIWVYSFLYNNFGKEGKYLDIAGKTRDFMVRNMYPGKGIWRESVDRRGNPVESTVSQGSSSDIYGALFSAAGLIELFKANHSRDDLTIALDSIAASVEAYESPDYNGIIVQGINQKGLRTVGHSFMLVWILGNLLSFHEDRKLEELQNEHINHILNDFWNPEYGISNENLYHDYSRLPGFETVMYTGHYLETLWMVLHEALRRHDAGMFETVKKRIRRLIEMTWDYVFEGMCTEEYYVFSREGRCQGPDSGLKVMWAHTELLIAAMMILEHTGETWALEWYGRGRDYCLRTMANTGNGVWRQAVDRYGNDMKRPEISIYRKDNFHQIRYMMMNCLSLERMIRNRRKPGKI